MLVAEMSDTDKEGEADDGMVQGRRLTLAGHGWIEATDSVVSTFHISQLTSIDKWDVHAVVPADSRNDVA